MAHTPQAALIESGPPYPTLNDLRAAQQTVVPSPNSGKLLFWPLDGPLDAAGVAVMASPTNPDARVPYFNQAAGEDGWHPISKLPISEPKVSSITVRVSELEDWEEMWYEMHCDHADEGGPEGAEWDEDRLVRCCGTARPADKDVSVVVTGTGGGENGHFVTVHDYLTTVHPWLIGLKSDILGAMGTLQGDDGPLGQNTELMVNYDGLASLMMEKRSEWIRLRKKVPVAVPPGFSLRELNGGSGNFGLLG